MASDDQKWKSILKEGFSKIDSDVRFLLGCLSETFEEMGETELSRLVNPDATSSDKEVLPERGPQALSIAFQLLNLVEENAAQQAIRSRENALGPERESGLWPHYLSMAQRMNISAETIIENLKKQSIEPVLTGHPTEAKRWTVLDQHRELYVLLVQLENQMYTDAERIRIRERIKAVLQHLWRTGEILMTKPDVRSERRNALYYFKEKFPDVLYRLDDRFRCAWERSGYGKDYELAASDYPRLKFGSWVGGDRDGHPLVTPSVTRDTLSELRQNAFEVIDQRLEKVQKRFGLSIYAQDIPDEFADRLKSLKRKVSARVHRLMDFQEEEPWRQFILLIRSKLPLPENSDCETPYRFPSQLIEDLEIVIESLKKIGAERIAREDVLPVIRLLEVFGFHLAALDVRQNSAFHDKAIQQLMDQAGLDGSAFVDGDEATRIKILEKELKTLRPFSRSSDIQGANAKGVVDTYAVLLEHIQSFGRAGIGSLIISMTRSLSDLLAVYVLAREAGLMKATPDGPICIVPVVPLFETIDDLRGSSEIVSEFLKHPITRRSLKWQNRELDDAIADSTIFDEKAPTSKLKPVQQIMLGYSDSNKDSGILASQWTLQDTQQELTALGKELNIDLQFFHGRGGTVSRGAGPTHRFLEALPRNTMLRGLRVTEQGETIAQKFTNLRTATYNLELLIAGTTGVTQIIPHRKTDDRLKEAMTILAESSRTHYQSFLKDPNFIQFYRSATPIDVLEVSRIGSRPSRRTGQMSLDDLRAIPWVFSWTQARFYFPGWYGVGTALEYLQEHHMELYDNLHKNVSEWPFLRYVLFNIESGLHSANPYWMYQYASLVKDNAIRTDMLSKVLNEFEKTKCEMDALLGGSLQNRRPRFFKTLKDREAELNMLHKEQIRLLNQWRAAPDKKKAESLLPSLLLTVNAIASGLRTTG